MGFLRLLGLSVFMGFAALGAKVTLTIPAAASIHGLAGTFFHSDLWVMNRSYVKSVTVTATYRCYASYPTCGKSPATMSLGPRQEQLVSDAVGTLFAAAETAGAIEL